MIRLRAAVTLLAVVGAGVALAADPTPGGPRAQAATLGEELAVHPDAGATDIYKLLHQGVFGPGHAVDDRTSAARVLDEEVAALGPAPVDEPLCQPLGGPIPMARIHLRPYIAAGLDPAALVDAFVASAAGRTGTAEDMDAATEAAVAFLVKRGMWGIASEVQELGATLAEQGYPIAHHSERYVELYRPAYRVVRLDIASAKGWCPSVEAEK